MAGVDVVVVGAGSAGLAAARRAAVVHFATDRPTDIFGSGARISGEAAAEVALRFARQDHPP